MTLLPLEIRKSALWELVSFCLVGVVNTAVGFSVIILLMEWAGWSPVASNACGYGVGLFVSFLLNGRLTFKSQSVGLGELSRFIAAFAIAYGINLIALFVAIHVLLLRAWIGQGLAMGIYTVVFFFLCRTFVFRRSGVGVFSPGA